MLVKKIYEWWEMLLREVRSHIPVYILLCLILIAAFFVRVYRIGDLLQFYYDQGRDALVIWKLWHEGKGFLIGPVTGLKGIFLGPLFYYLIAPFYLIGKGSPVYPAFFLAVLSTLSILMLYILGFRMYSRSAGIIAATIGAFSYSIATFSRWLSNPNPILLTSTVFLLCLWEIISSGNKSKVISGKPNLYWILAFLMIGVSLQFESASATFYIPLMLIFIIWQHKNLPNFKTLLLSGLVFFLTLFPQLVFNFRHENILFNNFKDLFINERAFRPFTKFILEERVKYFWNTFSTKLFPGWKDYALLFVAISLGSLITEFNRLKKHIVLLSVFLLTPMFGYILFQGNYGNIYDYYLSGYFLPFIVLFSVGMAALWEKKLGFLIVLLFFYKFFSLNGMLLRAFLTSTIYTRPISLEEQIPAVDWVFNDARGRGNFNVDIYVPPVIPYAYEYLFLWRAENNYFNGKYGCENEFCGMVIQQVPVLYTLYEPDSDHPDRINAWFERQNKTADVEEEVKVGHLTVQRRKRI